MAKALPLAAVLLAGGASRRFGSDNKLLAAVGGVPMARRVAGEILAAGIEELVVVTGAEREAYADVLADVPAHFIHASDWNDGIGNSIATGVRALSRGPAGVFIVPGDLPNLGADLLRTLIVAFADAGGNRVIVPVTAQGEQRNPVLWPRSYFPKLAALSGPHGGKSLLDTLDDQRVDVTFGDESLFADIDTQDDYARFVAGARGDVH